MERRTSIGLEFPMHEDVNGGGDIPFGEFWRTPTWQLGCRRGAAVVVVVRVGFVVTLKP